MSICEICGEVVDKVYICSECGAKFCRTYGDIEPKKKVCAFCSRNQQ